MRIIRAVPEHSGRAKRSTLRSCAPGFKSSTRPLSLRNFAHMVDQDRVSDSIRRLPIQKVRLRLSDRVDTSPCAVRDADPFESVNQGRTQRVPPRLKRHVSFVRVISTGHWRQAIADSEVPGIDLAKVREREWSTIRIPLVQRA